MKIRRRKAGTGPAAGREHEASRLQYFYAMAVLPGVRLHSPNLLLGERCWDRSVGGMTCCRTNTTGPHMCVYLEFDEEMTLEHALTSLLPNTWCADLIEQKNLRKPEYKQTCTREARTCT